ncbi:MAG: hypothetical protein ACE5H4_12275 [Candidatus Thorarchaeota archaeon]
MKPLGTVTMHYDFVDGQEREVLISIMSEATNYQDFVVRLGKHIQFKDATPVLAHIAAWHAWELRESEVTESIAKEFGDHPIVRPWTYPLRSRGDRLSIQDEVASAVESALATNPAKWLRMELLILKAYILILTPQGSSALDEAKALLEENPELRCYFPHVCHIDARIKWQEADLNNALRTCDQGIDAARELDNVYETARLVAWRGILTSSFQPREALAYHEEAYNLATSLGDQFLMAAVLIEMGYVSVILGEFDLALKYLQKGTSVYTPQEGPTDQHAVALSLIEFDLGHFDEALTWANWALEKHRDVGSEGDVWTVCAMTLALTALGRLEEASLRLDTARKLAFESGQEPDMAFYYYASGNYEVGLGNLETGLQLVEDALVIFERQGDRAFVNRCLHTLAQLELKLLRERNGKPIAPPSRSWMRRLELHGRDNKLPGFILQHALLQADYWLMEKDPEAARETLVRALDHGHSPGVKSLKDKIEEKIKQIDMENGEARSNTVTKFEDVDKKKGQRRQGL